MVQTVIKAASLVLYKAKQNNTVLIFTLIFSIKPLTHHFIFFYPREGVPRWHQVEVRGICAIAYRGIDAPVY